MSLSRPRNLNSRVQQQTQKPLYMHEKTGVGSDPTPVSLLDQRPLEIPTEVIENLTDIPGCPLDKLSA